MGMDVFGKTPVSERGSYFRNNVWWWRPLWEYCYVNHPDIVNERLAREGHSNSGAGLDAEGARKLGEALLKDIADGVTEKYKEDYYAAIAAIPREVCEYCDGTGIRTDDVGKRLAHDIRELDAHTALVLGRTHGWCNGCHGEGMVDPYDTHYPFEVHNVREFAEFLLDCGGFEIC